MSAASSSNTLSTNTTTTKPKKTPRVPEDAPIDEREKQVLALLSEKLAAPIAKHKVSQGTLLRFVRGFKDDPNPTQKALDTATEMLKWRETANVDAMVATVHPKADLFHTMWPAGLHGESRDGHPIYIERVGSISPSKLQKEFTHEDMVLFHVQTMERITAYKDRLSAARGRPIYKQVVILDLKGLSMSHLGDKFTAPMKKIMHIDQTYYPETLYTMIIVNAGVVVKAGWKLASPFLDPITKANIHFGNDKLLQWIDKGQLPQFLGGDCKCKQCLVSEFVVGPSDGKGSTVPVNDDEQRENSQLRESELMPDASPIPDASPSPLPAAQ